jgi:RNA polymerase sigma-70 factor (ECF subfamily)
VRAKAKIRETPIPYEVPAPQELPERLGAVLHVIYLVFNDGYSAAAGQDRSLWNREQIAEGVALLKKALESRRFGAG